MAPKSYTIQIETTANIPMAVPHMLKVNVGDMIKWVLHEGSARITFLDPTTVEFENGSDITTPQQPAQGVAQKEGFHEYAISFWNDSYKPGSVVEVLIIEPRVEGDSNA